MSGARDPRRVGESGSGKYYLAPERPLGLINDPNAVIEGSIVLEGP